MRIDFQKETPGNRFMEGVRNNHHIQPQEGKIRRIFSIGKHSKHTSCLECAGYKGKREKKELLIDNARLLVANYGWNTVEETYMCCCQEVLVLILWGKIESPRLSGGSRDFWLGYCPSSQI